MSIEALIPRKTSIIDVALLHGLSEPATDMLTILGAEGRKASLPRAVVTALTAEITIHMREKPDDFFDHTDLLDFPGYRSRMKLRKSQSGAGTTRHAGKPLSARQGGLPFRALLRGKGTHQHAALHRTRQSGGTGPAPRRVRMDLLHPRRKPGPPRGQGSGSLLCADQDGHGV